MVRIAPRLLCCAGLVLVAVVMAHAGPEDEQKIENTLKVATALVKGSEAIKCGHYREAVDLLEGQLALIGDNRQYLNALRDAYQGLIQELKQKNQEAEAVRYQRRLSALDPGTVLETGERRGNSPPASAPGPAKPTPVAERSAQAIDQDPFSDANSVTFVQARGLLEQADRAYAKQQYSDACKLYEQSFQNDPRAAPPAVKERWAYCKLDGVVRSLNRPQSPLPPQEMEREVRLAMSMAPKLAPTCTDLLRKIQERHGSRGAAAAEPAVASPVEEPAAVEIRHQPARGDGWTVCETANFRIFHKQSSQEVERVARAAEAARIASARKWFGEVPAAWSPRCDLYLHLNRADYSRETRQPPDCPGHSTIAMDGERVVSRRIDLHCDDMNMVPGVLPHETTHVVLAGRFGVPHLPRWADEGMAVLSEPRERVEKHLRNLPQHQRDRQLFAIRELMLFNEYPEGKWIGSFYAQSVSLVDYLCQQKDPQAFSVFLRDGLRNGYETALRQHYGFNSFEDLQRRWQTATLGNGSAYAGRGR